VNLAQTQRLFWELLRGERRPLEGFVGSPELPVAERMAIYARMFLDRQVEALHEAFPKVAAALGAGAFHDLAARYVLAHPSEHPDLGQLGRQFAGFLDRGDLADLARLEWARGEVFEAASADSLSTEEFARLAQDPAAFASHRVRLIPALRLLRLGHDVGPLWDGTAKAAEKRPAALLVWRAGLEVFHVEVDADEARAVQVAIQGGALGDVCGALGDPARAVETLQGWLGEGLFAR
jgi:hypothetical protein